jgi:hypothetical protein
MRKVTKILGKVIATVVLLLIVLPVFLSLLLSINAVQNCAVRFATDLASRKLETVVRIDHVDIGIFHRLQLSGIYVEDYGGDTLLYVKHLDAFIAKYGILTDEFNLQWGKLSGGKFYLREMSDSVMNIKQIIARLQRKEQRDSKFRLSISALTVDDLEFRLEKLQHRNPTYGIDFSDMDVQHIHAVIDNFTIDGGAIGAQIEELSAREKSGFSVRDFCGRFFLVNGCIGMEDAHIVTAQSNIQIPSVSLVGNSWLDYRDYVHQVSMSVDVQNSILSSHDVAYFAPKLKAWNLLLQDIDIGFEGTVADFDADLRHMRWGERSKLCICARVHGLPHLHDTHFSVRVDDCVTNGPDVAYLKQAVTTQAFSEQLSTLLNRAGSMKCIARAEGSFDNFQSEATVTSNVGATNLTLALQTVPATLLHRIDGAMTVNELHLGKILNQQKLGSLVCDATLHGEVGSGALDARLNGAIQSLDYNNHLYDSIRFDGLLTKHSFNGGIRCNDDALKFDFQGIAGFGDDLHYDFGLNLHQADLVAMGLNHRDSLSKLAFVTEVCASGRTLDDLNGQIEFSKGRYYYNTDTLALNRLLLEGRNSSQSKSLKLNSDYLDAEFHSKTNYKTVFGYVQSSIERYIPMLSQGTHEQVNGRTSMSQLDSTSTLKVKAKHLNPLLDAIDPGLQVADNSQLTTTFNHNSNQITVTATSDYVERNRIFATKLSLNLANNSLSPHDSDSLHLDLHSDELYIGTMRLPNFFIFAGALNENMSVRAMFRDATESFSGKADVVARLQHDAQRGRTIDLSIGSTYIQKGNQCWNLYSDGISIDTAQIAIRQLTLSNASDNQEMFVNGIASRHLTDSLRIHLHNFDLSPLSQLVQSMGYNISGYADGHALVRSALRGAEITANMTLDSVNVNQLSAPPMRLVSVWDLQNNRARIMVTDREKQDTLIRGFYVPTEVRYYAEGSFPRLKMKLLDPLLQGVIANTEGEANVSLTLEGQHRQANLRGFIDVHDFATTVDYTKVPYTIPSARITVDNNRLHMQQADMFDPQGNKGSLSLDLNLQHLSNISYALTLTPRNMLVLNTEKDDNELFYGHVMASGRASINGNKAGVKMNIEASTNDNTTFCLPLSSKSNVSRVDFVTFESPKQQQADTLNILERKRLMYERKHHVKTTSGSPMDINMTLNVLPNADFQLVIDPTVGDIIKGNGEGTLNLHINPRSNIFEMYGDYTITEGSYLFTLQNIINKRFTIESGSTIQWTGEPLDAQLNINAVYKLKTSLQPLIGSSVSTGGGSNLNRAIPVECIINLSDRLSQPTVTFDVKVPTADAEYQTIVANTLNSQSAIAEQFMYLIVANSFYSDLSGSSNNLGATASAATGFELLSNQLSNWLSSDDYNVVFRYRPKSELSGDEVDFGFSKSLINNRLYVEVEGNYLIDNSQAVNQQMSNFMGEAYVTWLIDRAGTLKLKGFTQTIDRFDENQGLQETGVGIYYKEDFNNFKDLKERIKNKFRSRRKREQQSEASPVTPQDSTAIEQKKE